jgi:acetyl-CoA carboxylase biotin carboxyl carrier protein
MKIDQIKALTEIFNAADITVLEVCEGDTKIRIEKSADHVSPPTAVASANPAPISDAPEAHDDAQVNFNNLVNVTSPIVGIFYSAPSPDSLPFVSIGSKVKKGDVLCIIEAMKQMNEITSDADGEILDICIKNGDIAEFGQVLFKIV